jgi:mannose/fructose-specific phosphotransferase system component IIA
VAIVSFSKPIDWPYWAVSKLCASGGAPVNQALSLMLYHSSSVICALSITLLPVRFCTRQYFADQNNAKQSRPTIQQKIG